MIAAGFNELARRIDLYSLVLETDSPLLSPHGLACGHPYELINQAQMIAKDRNLLSWVVHRVAALNAQHQTLAMSMSCCRSTTATSASHDTAAIIIHFVKKLI